MVGHGALSIARVLLVSVMLPETHAPYSAPEPPSLPLLSLGTLRVGARRQYPWQQLGVYVTTVECTAGAWPAHRPSRVASVAATVLDLPRVPLLRHTAFLGLV